MNILLVYPEFPYTFWSFKHALKFIRKKASLPPLGLLTVAAMLPPEWEKRLVDVNVTALQDRHLEWADYAFISAMTVQRDSTRQIVARCKQAGMRWHREGLERLLRIRCSVKDDSFDTHFGRWPTNLAAWQARRKRQHRNSA